VCLSTSEFAARNAVSVDRDPTSLIMPNLQWTEDAKPMALTAHYQMLNEKWVFLVTLDLTNGRNVVEGMRENAPISVID
jgi:hypothetical protein